MRGIKFGDVHTWARWGLVLHAKTINPPTPRTDYVQIPGRDGAVDMSDALTGRVMYDNRTVTFNFLLVDGKYSEREEIIADIINTLHGKKFDIITDDRPDLYFVGRCSVKTFTNDKAYGSITVDCTCDPYRYAVNEIIRPYKAGNTSSYCINRGNKPIIPVFEVEGSVTVTLNGATATFTTGIYRPPEYVLIPGLNTLTFRMSGASRLTIKYREAYL